MADDRLEQLCAAVGVDPDGLRRLARTTRRTLPALVNRAVTQNVYTRASLDNVSWEDAVASFGLRVIDDEWGYAPETQQ